MSTRVFSGCPGDAAPPAEGGDKIDLDGLTRSLEETKGKMAHMEKLLEEAAYEPVVTETLLGEE